VHNSSDHGNTRTSSHQSREGSTAKGHINSEAKLGKARRRGTINTARRIPANNKEGAALSIHGFTFFNNSKTVEFIAANITQLRDQLRIFVRLRGLMENTYGNMNIQAVKSIWSN
jgi:hypothetical protein